MAIENKRKHGNLGKKMSLVTRKKMSESHKLNPTKYWQDKKMPQGIREKISDSLKGNKLCLGKRWELPHRRKADYPEYLRLRKSSDMVQWRKSVFLRDDFTRQWCGQYGGKLNADHIKPFSKFPELRLILTNGRTLCVSCHRKTDTYGARSIRNSIINS